MIVYENKEEFFSSIGVSELEDNDEIKSRFINPFVYYLYCSNDRKSYENLFYYIDQFLLENEKIELYTCFAEDKFKQKDDSLDIIINFRTNHYTNHLGTFKLNEKRLHEDLSERFMFRERQYVVVIK